MTINIQSVEITSDSAGDVTATLRANGRIAQIVINPDGTDVPTALWDLTVTDENSVQIFTDVALSEANTTTANPIITKTNTDFMFPVAGLVTLVGANMGSAKKALIILYVEN